MPKKPTEPKRGRPPAGIAPGEAVRDYRRMTVYIDPAASAVIERIADQTGLPRWRVIHDAVMRLDQPRPRKRR